MANWSKTRFFDAVRSWQAADARAALRERPELATACDSSGRRCTKCRSTCPALPQPARCAHAQLSNFNCGGARAHPCATCVPFGSTDGTIDHRPASSPEWRMSSPYSVAAVLLRHDTFVTPPAVGDVTAFLRNGRFSIAATYGWVTFPRFDGFGWYDVSLPAPPSSRWDTVQTAQQCLRDNVVSLGDYDRFFVIRCLGEGYDSGAVGTDAVNAGDSHFWIADQVARDWARMASRPRDHTSALASPLAKEA